MGSSSSKREGEAEFTLPTGLYQTCNWDVKTIRRLVLAKRLAPLFPGKDECLSPDNEEECPICFLFYPGGLNRSTCCKKGICTECFLQIKKPTAQASCPFCQRSNYSVVFTGPLSKEERERDAWEQQQVLDAKIRMRNEEIEQDRLRELQRIKERGIKPVSADGESANATPSTSPQSTGMEHVPNSRFRDSEESDNSRSGYSPDFSNSPVGSPLSFNRSPESTPNRSPGLSPKSSLSNYSPTIERRVSPQQAPQPQPPLVSSSVDEREMQLEDLMLQEALRLSLAEDNASDTESVESKESSESNDANSTKSTEGVPSPRSKNQEDLDLALALALSMQGIQNTKITT